MLCCGALSFPGVTAPMPGRLLLLHPVVLRGLTAIVNAYDGLKEGGYLKGQEGVCIGCRRTGGATAVMTAIISAGFVARCGLVHRFSPQFAAHFL